MVLHQFYFPPLSKNCERIKYLLSIVKETLQLRYTRLRGKCNEPFIYLFIEDRDIDLI